MRPQDGESLPERVLVVELGHLGSRDVEDAKLELDDLVGGSRVDLSEDSPGLVLVSPSGEDSRRLGEEVHQAELKDGRDNSESD